MTIFDANKDYQTFKPEVVFLTVNPKKNMYTDHVSNNLILDNTAFDNKTREMFKEKDKFFSGFYLVKEDNTLSYIDARVDNDYMVFITDTLPGAKRYILDKDNAYCIYRNAINGDAYLIIPKVDKEKDDLWGEMKLLNKNHLDTILKEKILSISVVFNKDEIQTQRTLSENRSLVYSYHNDVLMNGMIDVVIPSSKSKLFNPFINVPYDMCLIGVCDSVWFMKNNGNIPYNALKMRLDLGDVFRTSSNLDEYLMKVNWVTNLNEIANIFVNSMMGKVFTSAIKKDNCSCNHNH